MIYIIPNHIPKITPNTPPDKVADGIRKQGGGLGNLAYFCWKALIQDGALKGRGHIQPGKHQPQENAAILRGEGNRVLPEELGFVSNLDENGEKKGFAPERERAVVNAYLRAGLLANDKTEIARKKYMSEAEAEAEKYLEAQRFNTTAINVLSRPISEYELKGKQNEQGKDLDVFLNLADLLKDSHLEAENDLNMALEMINNQDSLSECIKFCKEHQVTLTLFSKNPEQLNELLNQDSSSQDLKVKELSKFLEESLNGLKEQSAHLTQIADIKKDLEALPTYLDNLQSALKKLETTANAQPNHGLINDFIQFCKRELFKGLYIDGSDYNWEKHPIIHLSLTETDSGSLDNFYKSFRNKFKKLYEEHDLQPEQDLPLGSLLSNLITELSKKYKKQVVVLIDEYDKPLVNNITNTELAVKFREELKSLYTILKDNDSHIRFLLLTGVSKFSRVSVFSGLNNLSDLSMNDDYASICGYTQEELEKYFKPYFPDLSDALPKGYELLDSIKNWYNGYRFSEKDIRVYNPFSTLQLFHEKKFKNYWFATGTPTFLIDLIKKQSFYKLDMLPEEEVDQSDFDAYEIDNLKVLPLLFQTGYLTIKDYTDAGFNKMYKLDFPNREVRYAFNNSLLKSLSTEDRAFSGYAAKIYNALHAKDFEKLLEILKSYLAHFPYNVQIPEERYYQSIIFSIFSMIYDSVTLEEPTNMGRSDMVINLKDLVYVMEFKINQSAQKALEQIKAKKYYEKYKDSGKEIILIGMNFKTDIHNIDDWVVEGV